MAQEKLSFHTPVGRFVNGSLTERRTKDHQNRDIDLEDQKFQFGVAIEKTNPDLPAMINNIVNHAVAGYSHQPQLAQRAQAWMQTMSGFSMKISDGDRPNSKGQISDNTRGCFVLWYSTNFDILTANSMNQQIDQSLIKRGWYVDVASTVAVNGLLDNNAGIYMNPVCVRLIGEGDEILGGMTVDSALENAPVAPTQLPPGARPVGSTPQAPASSGAPGTGLPGAVPVQQAAAPETIVPVGGGLPGAAGPGGTVSPGEIQHPPHPGIMGLPGS